MYRIVDDEGTFFIQITEDENYERERTDCNVPYCTLANVKDKIYRGPLGFNSKEDAENHIETLDHTEWCIPDKKRSKLEKV